MQKYVSVLGNLNLAGAANKPSRYRVRDFK